MAALAVVAVPRITLRVSPSAVPEDGTRNLLFTFTRSAPTTEALAVSYRVGGTATLGTDYTGIDSNGTTKTVIFAAGSSTALVLVDPTADTLFEANESVALTLAAGAGYTIGTSSAVTGLISNDDQRVTTLPSISLAVSPAAVAEDGTSNLVFRFSRSGATTSPLTVNYTVGGSASLGSDYTGIVTAGATKTITFAAGSATATLSVDPTADATLEPDETVALTLAAGAGYTIGTSGAVSGTISNDDTSTLPLPVAAGDGLKGEYFDNLNFTTPVLTRIDPSINFDWGEGSPAPGVGADTFSVRWSGQVQPLFSETYTFFTTSDDGVRLYVNDQLIIDGFVDQSATERSGTINLVAGQKYNIRMDYYDNTLDAVSRLAWSSPSQAKQIIPQSQLYSGLTQFSIKDNATIYVGEAAGVANVIVQRTGDLNQRVTLQYTTNGIGGTGSAQASEDYTQPSLNGRFNTGEVVFEVGEKEKTIAIPIIDDALLESNETFSVGIQNPSTGTLGAPRTTLITIIDNEGPSTISVSEPALSVSEGPPTATISVQRSGDTSQTATVNFTTTSGTAIGGQDYTNTAGTLTFAKGEITKRISVPINNDTQFEPNEQFTLTLSNPTGAGLGSVASSTLTILDNDTVALTRRTVVSGLNDPTSLDWTPDLSTAAGYQGFMLVAQKNGIVKVVDSSNNLRATPLIDISSQVNYTRDRGLLGIAIHPDFAKGSPYVYLLYTYDPPETASSPIGSLAGPDGNGNRPSRLVRVTVNPQTMVADPSSLKVLAGTNSTWAYTSQPGANSTGDTSIPPSGIVNGTTITASANNINTGTQDNNPLQAGIQNQNIKDYLATDSETHSIGAVHFGSDGKLYFSNGDGTSYNFADQRSVRVQDVNNLSGKVLRIDPITGAGVADNPFYNASDPFSNASKVFYSGVRNAFRFTFDPITNLPVLGDVGWSTWEEINTGAPGANFGWPYLEGPSLGDSYQTLPQAIAFYNNGNRNNTTDAPAVFPLLSRSHGAPDNATAIMVGDFYNNNTLMFGDVVGGTLYAATFNSSRQITSVGVFDSGIPYVVDMEMGPNNQLYGVNLVNGTVLQWTAV